MSDEEKILKIKEILSELKKNVSSIEKKAISQIRNVAKENDEKKSK